MSNYHLKKKVINQIFIEVQNKKNLERIKFNKI